MTSPLSRANYGNAMTWSADWGFATAHIQRPDGTTQVLTGNGDSTWEAGIPIRACQRWGRSYPALISLHQVTGDWDTGEYLGLAALRASPCASG